MSQMSSRFVWDDLSGLFATPRPKSARKYSEDQPRDDHGRWGSGGFTSSHEATIALSHLVSDHTYVEDHPIAIAAATATHAVLAEMKIKGYAMPNSVDVHRASGPAHGETAWYIPTEATVGNSQLKTKLRVMLPETIPTNVSLKDIVASTFGGTDPENGAVDKFTVRSVKDIVIHEMGHVLAGGRGSMAIPEDHPMARVNEDAARSVSRYAARNQDEFLAEAFTRLYRGETLRPDAQRLYDRLNGPKVKP